MAEQSNVSFIPKRSFAQRRKVQRRSPRLYLLTIISMALLFGTVLAASVVFLLHFNADRQLQAHIEQLQEARNNFSQDDFFEVNEFDSRISYVLERLDQRTSPYRLLQLLETVTNQDVEITNMSLSTEADDAGEAYAVSLQLIAQDLNSIQNQRDVFIDNEKITNVLIADTLAYVSTVDEFGETTAAESTAASFEFLLPHQALAFDPNLYEFVDSESALEVQVSPDGGVGSEALAPLSPVTSSESDI